MTWRFSRKKFIDATLLPNLISLVSFPLQFLSYLNWQVTRININNFTCVHLYVSRLLELKQCAPKVYPTVNEHVKQFLKQTINIGFTDDAKKTANPDISSNMLTYMFHFDIRWVGWKSSKSTFFSAASSSDKIKLWVILSCNLLAEL